MGCYDGAEVCELVGIYILNKLSNIIDIGSIGHYEALVIEHFDTIITLLFSLEILYIYIYIYI